MHSLFLLIFLFLFIFYLLDLGARVYMKNTSRKKIKDSYWSYMCTTNVFHRHCHVTPCLPHNLMWRILQDQFVNKNIMMRAWHCMANKSTTFSKNGLCTFGFGARAIYMMNTNEKKKNILISYVHNLFITSIVTFLHTCPTIWYWDGLILIPIFNHFLWWCLIGQF